MQYGPLYRCFLARKCSTEVQGLLHGVKHALNVLFRHWLLDDASQLLDGLLSNLAALRLMLMHTM
jgi:hypothetical protein